MVFFKLILLCLGLTTLCACAKLGYIAEQGAGQLKIQWSAIPNKNVLEDPKVLNEHKEKIKAITAYKRFFEEYFGVELNKIYEKTTFLDRDAVSFMVTASKPTEIKPYQLSFPLVGSFPYLAFFNKKSAEDFEAKLQSEGYVTWMRPVYAYSSLNYFTDRILSSFFEYSVIELAELVFHELTHLSFFAKDDVAFNESLAQYFSHKLLREYFKETADVFLDNRLRSRELSQKLVPIVVELNARYQNLSDDTDFMSYKNRYLQERFGPLLEESCREKQGGTCEFNPELWNNARLAGFMNYEGLYERIESVHKRSGLNLRDFMNSLKKNPAKPKSSLSYMEYLESRELKL